MSSTNSLKKNVIVEAVCRIVTMVLALLLVPIIIRQVGVAGYGTWAVFLTVAQVLMVFQTAITGTFLWAFSTAFHNEQQQKIKRLAGIGLTINVVHVLVVLLIFFVARSWLLDFFKVPQEFVRIITFVMIASLVSGFAELLNSIVSGAQQMALSSSLRTAATFLQQLVSIVFLLQGYGLWALVIGLFSNQALTVVGGLWLVRRVAPELKMRPCLPNAEETQLLRGYGGSLMVGCVSANLRAQLDRIVLASAASVTWVGYYEIATRLCSLIFEFNRYFFMPLIPASAALYAQNKKVELKRLFAQFMTITGFATGAATVVVGGIHDRLMMAWIGSTPSGAILILYILLLSGFIQLILTGPGAAMCRGIGKANIETHYLTLSLIINVVLTVVLVKVMGFIGTVVASAIATLISSVYFVTILHQKTSLPASESWRTLRNCVAVIASIALLRILILFVVPAPAHFADRLHAAMWLMPLIAVGVIFYSALYVILRAGDPQTLSILPRKFPFLKRVHI